MGVEIAESPGASAPARRCPEAVPAIGERVLLRAATPGDAGRLGRMFSRCSAETIRLRFHHAFRRVPEAVLSRLVVVDPRLGKAVVAEAGGEVVGHAMYARERAGDREAEVAVVVEDGWSSKGIGRLLLAEIRERTERGGVEALVCTTLGDNHRVQDVARRAFPGARISFSDGACSMRLPLKEARTTSPRRAACPKVGATTNRGDGRAPRRRFGDRYEHRSERKEDYESR